MSDPAADLASIYLNYERYIGEQEATLKRLADEMKARPERADVLARLQKATEHNCGLVRTLQEKLRKHVSVADVAAAIPTMSAKMYLAPWEYLRRDWCGLAEGEAEIEAVERFVLGVMESYPPSLQSVLVLGAGTGRVAWDLAQRAERVYAIDNSFTMVDLFAELQETSISFFEINRSNIRTPGDAVRSLTASLAPVQKGELAAERRALPVYVVADGLNAPLADHSVSAVVSVYFTDLVPSAAYLAEIKRVLAPGGLFVHFGPLEYRFSAISDCLSAGELRALFEANGFTVLADGSSRTRLLSSELSMLALQYDNWTFAAVNGAAPSA